MHKQSYRIDNWFFVPHENRLVLDEQEILIDNRLSNLLLFLCDNPRTTLSRDEIIDHVWKGSILTDQVITQAIFELRKILKTNNQHLQGYIITVPKRGYKLDTDVEVVNEVKTAPTVLNAAHKIVESNAEQKSNFAAKEATKHKKATENEEPTTAVESAKSVRFSSSLAIVGALIAVAVLVVFFNRADIGKQPSVEHVVYADLEPRVIEASIDNSLANASLQNGVIFKVIEYLKYNVNYRVSFNPKDHLIAAKKLSFIVTRENGIDYVNIEYFNKISNYQHLDRKYPISEKHLKHSIKLMIDDVLDAFNIDIAKSEIDLVLRDMPEEPAALALSLEAIGTLHSYDKQFDAIDLLAKALEIDPTSHYLLSMNYIYNMTIAYLGKSNLSIDSINSLNSDFEQILPQISESPESFKVYEAMALHALSKDLPIEAVQHLNQIPHTHNTIMTYILRAKLAESFGNPASAEEFYYQALHESGTPRVLDFAESLLFYSDLSKMRLKLLSQLESVVEDQNK
ncbi:Transcriptional activator CadC [Shewanella piezotolerans WP3]|uniref:Transcriptional activator CadC n=1 Tax=Shewanella piezotolerans (strain WP3 / JCM 13877) TaxID=225849 RepID=B8CR40_SHEPW|nr:winged helix-turn-helix domain-containing protein [Shewanella piezotolerans]ACJ29712.1 Transcriptional activator CadC [Shewanella piezotolerans WP3]